MVTWLANVRTGNKNQCSHLPAQFSAFSLHYLPHFLNWFENKVVMSPKLFSPWAQRIFNWGRMCPNLWWETINTASVELLGHGPLFQQRHFIMGGKRRWRGRDCHFSLFSKSFVSLLNCVCLPNMTLESFIAQAIPMIYPNSSVLCLVVDISAMFHCQAIWIGLGWVLFEKGSLGYTGFILSVIQWGQVSKHLPY